MNTTAQLRIGELARRTGVATELLRAWERRYGLLAPTRTAAGYRLYSDEDVRRVSRMRDLVGRGVAAAEAARTTLAEASAGVVEAAPDAAAAELREALERLDDVAAQAAFDRLLADLTVPAVLEQVVLPLLRDIGDRWARGEVSVAQEHFASNLLRGRMLGLARGWGRGTGRRAVLACPPGERHDLGLIAFGLALRDEGWRITFVGADTPLDALLEVVRGVRPDAVVLGVADPKRLASVEAALPELRAEAPVWLGGAGARPLTGAEVLAESPLAAAAQVANA
ncbi:MAG TPA: MerR family transcriptional regulator [Gaiellaceae bacterium]|jgi:DNA-binding transcriptional MerR regulator